MIRRFCIFSVLIFSKLFHRHRVYGKSHFPKGGGIIAPNHCSFLDPPLVGISSPGEVHFLGRESLFHQPLFAWLIRQLNTHPVRRGKGNIYAFKKALELIESGNKVVIFPEGKRSPTGELQKGELGIGMLVQRTRCLVIPVYLHGTFDVWNTHRKFPKLKGKTACVFGSPLDFSTLASGDKKEEQEAIVEAIMRAIASLRSWYLNGAKGIPP